MDGDDDDDDSSKNQLLVALTKCWVLSYSLYVLLLSGCIVPVVMLGPQYASTLLTDKLLEIMF